MLHLGPVEGSRRTTGAMVPVSKNHSNGNLDSTAPSKSERLNSPNTGNWEPDVRMLLSTCQWLKVQHNKLGVLHNSIKGPGYIQPMSKFGLFFFCTFFIFAQICLVFGM